MDSQMYLYPIILILIILIIYFSNKRKSASSIVKSKQALNNADRSTKGYNMVKKANFNWSVVVKSKGKLYKGLEADDLGKVGYYIYQNFAKKLDQVEVYVKDNRNNEILKIQKTYESECMIGVDDPENGHIGYLPYEKVDRIE